MNASTLKPDRDRVVKVLERLAAVDQRSHVWKKVPENLIIEACELLVTPGTPAADVHRFLTEQGHDPGRTSFYRFAAAFRRQYLAVGELDDLHSLPVAEVAGRLQVTPQALEALVRTGKLTKRDVAGESRIPAGSLRRFLAASNAAQPADDAALRRNTERNAQQANRRS